MERLSDLDQAWQELIFDALASDGRITDQHVKDAVRRNRPKIEALLEHEHSVNNCYACEAIDREAYRQAAYDYY